MAADQARLAARLDMLQIEHKIQGEFLKNMDYYLEHINRLDEKIDAVAAQVARLERDLIEGLRGGLGGGVS